MKDEVLVVIDVQNCFMPDGALPVANGDKVVPVLNRYIKLFRREALPVYATRDWHPEFTHHFKDYGGDWPAHCIQGTEGAKFHPDLELPEDMEIISAGMDPNSQGYSSFEGVNEQGVSFEESLRGREIKHLFVGGLATDYCVKTTVLDALQKSFRVTVLMDAIKGVEVEPGDSTRALEAMIRAGARLGNFKDVEEEFGGVQA